jgi:hypothetical protein
VLTVEIYTMTGGLPSALPAACAPVSTSVGAPQLPQVHQVSSQSELAVAPVRTRGSYGTNGFTVTGIRLDDQPVVVARGVPPRGRPV